MCFLAAGSSEEIEEEKKRKGTQREGEGRKILRRGGEDRVRKVEGDEGQQGENEEKAKGSLKGEIRKEWQRCFGKLDPSI